MLNDGRFGRARWFHGEEETLTPPLSRKAGRGEKDRGTTTMTTPSLHTQLRRFGRRVLLVGLLAGAAWAVAAALVLAVAGAWLDLVWELPPVGRIVCLAAAAVGAVVVVTSAAYLVSRRRQPRELARRLDR